MTSQIQKAKELAIEKHAHLHLYNAAKTPAIQHITEVTTLVQEYGGDEDMVCAAWLHDIVEDTDVKTEDIKSMFGENIANIVDGLTDPPDYSGMSLPVRKAKQAERIKGKSDSIKIIKICDQLSNILRITNDPPVDWDDVKRWQYVLGAKKIVDACKGISPILESKFNDAFECAKEKYGMAK